MTIVYISDSAIPSSSPNSVHVMKMCQAFARLGHKVKLVGKNTTACFNNVKDAHEFYSVEKKFELKIFPTKAFKGSGLFYNIYLPFALTGMKADLVYTRSITAAYAGLKLGKPIIFEMHEPFEEKGARLSNMFKYIAENKKLVKLVVISDQLKQYCLKNFAIKEENITVAHDGADPLPQGNAVNIKSGFKVGYIGSLYPGKGMEILLPLAGMMKDIDFHVVGGNDKQIAEWKQKIGALPNVTFYGFKTQAELPSYIRAFDVLVAPYSKQVTVSTKKGANNLALWMSPLKLFEYMSGGKPIITTDLPVIREILTHRQTALLCNAEDINQWKQAVNELKDNNELRKNLGNKALKDFEENYTWLKRAEHILNSVKQ